MLKSALYDNVGEIMKRVISFAVLFLVGISNSYGWSNNVNWNGCGEDVVVTDEDSIGCNITSGSTHAKLDPGEWMQTIGYSYCLEQPNRFHANNAAFKCNNNVVDWWTVTTTNWDMSKTVHTHDRDGNAEYRLQGTDGTIYGPVAANGQSYYARNGKIWAKCKHNYTSNGSSCQPVSGLAKCTPSDSVATFHATHSCSLDSNTRCLQIGVNTKLYCNSYQTYQNNYINVLDNTCIQDKHRVVVKDQPEGYFLCTADDKWELKPFARCPNNIDKFPNGCNGIDNCITKIQKNNTDYNLEHEVFTSAPTGFCAYSVCENGYTEVNGSCVSNAIAAKATKCAESFGEWDYQNNKCTCDRNKNLKPVGDKCECKNAQYTRDNTRRNCFYNAEALKAACIDSLGTWEKGEGNALDKCVCKPETKIRYDDQEQKCICIDLDKEIKIQNGVKDCYWTDAAQQKQDCNASGEAQWKEGKCVCNENTKIWDDTNNKCIDNPEYTKCNSITGAEWDGNKRECKCKDSGQKINSDETACEDTPETIAKKKMAASDTVIKETFVAFEDEVKKLKVDKWKTQDGKFNVARLASDSIAGVVLGTVGGLVTSKVVKKNQVKKGFENIRCVIGGQIVADYGDEFMVGSK